VDVLEQVNFAIYIIDNYKGKSTFGMSVALSQSILKCVSTDVIREITRTTVDATPPALMRSSYEGDSDPVLNWKETCHVLNSGIQGLVDDAMKRGTSLVLEGVHIQPNNVLLDQWRANGGVALGCLLVIKDSEAHRSLIFRRGEITKKGEEKKLKAFERIRKIQDEMIAMAISNNWLLIEQRIEPDPLDKIASYFSSDGSDLSANFPLCL
jgi:2-phosphoglycerate kinase